MKLQSLVSQLDLRLVQITLEFLGKASTAPTPVVEETEAPRFVERLKDIEVKEHDTVTLECKVVGKPEPEVVWTRNGVPVNIDGNKIISRKDADGKQTLIIKDADSSSAGKFTCTATNKAGRDFTSGDLKVPKQVTETKPEESVQPFFIEPLQNQQITKEGESAVLRCKINPESKPNIQWSKNGVPIQSSPNMVVEKLDDGTLKLTIHNVKKEDLGNYKVEAVNPSGKCHIYKQHATQTVLFRKGFNCS